MFNSGAGERIGGYRVVRRLATGGTSDVLLAKAEGPHGFERTVVLKLLLAQYQDDPDAMAMFAREASAYARLSHPSIVQLYDFFALDGQLVMVLEYVDGPALHRLRGMLRTVGQYVEDKGALYLASRVFSALAAAHGARDDAGRPAPVIHRDVNPSNILLPWDGQVKIADFGVAKVSGTQHQSTVGVLKGTYGYMAPEQITGEPVTPATDVYAGAIVLWELLTKRRAFQRGALPEVEALRQMSEPRIPSLDTVRPDLPEELRDLMRRALVPDVRRRDVTADEAVSLLRTLVSTDEGRESLAASLAAVRHEPRPAMTSAPPPEEETQRVPVASPPRPPPVPPKIPVSPSSASGVVTSAPPLPKGGAPPRTFREPPPASTRTPPPPRPTPRKPSVPAASEVAGSARDAGRGIGTRTTSGLGPIATPSDPVALKKAIDEVLREAPSAIPPSVFDVAESPKPGATESGRDLGGLPPAPAPLVSSRSPSQPLSFPALDRTLTMDTRPGGSNDAAAAPPPPRPEPATLPSDDGGLPFPVRPVVPGSGPGPFGGLLGLTVPLPPAVARPDAESPATSSSPSPGVVTQPSPGSPRVPSEPPAATMPLPPVGPAAPPPHAPPAVLQTPVNAMKSPGVPIPSASTPKPSAPSMDGATTMASAGVGGMLSTPTPPPPQPPPPLPVATTSSAPVATGVANTTDRTSIATPRRKPRRWPLALVGVVVLAASGGVTWKERDRLAAHVQSVRRGGAETAVDGGGVGAAAVPGVGAPAEPDAGATTNVEAPAGAAVDVAVDAGTNPEALPATAEHDAGAEAHAEADAKAKAEADAKAKAEADAKAAKPAAAGETTGVIRTEGSTPNRRIFVDERTVGQTPASVTVKCGLRAVRLGSTGKTQRLEVPCGGEIAISDR